MAEIVALTGGILLILALSGVKVDSKIVRMEQPMPQGDRAAAVLLGSVLIAVAAILEADLDEIALWVAFTAGAAIAVAYAVFIWRSRG